MNNYQFANANGNLNGNMNTAPYRYTGYTTALPANPVVAMAYVPFQTDSTTYEDSKGYRCGTLFPVLYKPFIGRGAR